MRRVIEITVAYDGNDFVGTLKRESEMCFFISDDEFHRISMTHYDKDGNESECMMSAFEKSSIIEACRNAIC